MSLEAALRDCHVTTRDERGLIPLAEARATLAAATVVTRDNLDAVWAAMCSLEDGGELARAAAHLDWQMPPRGRDNVALVERYGAAVLPWIATRIGHGVLVNHPWCVVPCLRALDDPGALELLLAIGGLVADGGAMVAWVFTRPAPTDDREALAAAALDEVLTWTRLHPDVAYPVLARQARDGGRAALALRELAARAPADVATRLVALGASELVTALALPAALSVDRVVAQLAAASEQSWPVFHTNVDGRCEYFGQRVIGVRARRGDGWALVFERMQGSDPDMFQLARYAYGPATVNGYEFDHSPSLEFGLEGDVEDGSVYAGATARGPAGELRIDESIFARHELRPGWNTEWGSWSARTVAIRAYLAEHPDAWWPPPEDALAATGIDDGEIVVVSRAYQHPCYRAADDEPQPWQIGVDESPVMRSLIDAVLARDPSRFAPGESNLDWRLHARCKDDGQLPWTEYHRPLDDGWVAAAMKQAAVTVDERGLMAIEDARAVVEHATALARGDGRRVGDAWVWDHDRLWAAIVSLDAAEAAADVLGRIDLDLGPRNAATNTALAERYGDGALAIVAARASADGVIIADSPFLRATVLAIGTPAAFRFVWDLTGWREAGADGTPDAQAGALFAAWVNAHPAVGFVELGRLAAAGDAAALSFLTTWAAPQARKVFRWLREALREDVARSLYDRAGLAVELAPVHLLAVLDHAAASPGDAWPRFVTGAGPSREYHGLRLVAARMPEGDDWIVVFERYEGYGHHLKVQRYVYADDLVCGLRADAARDLAERAHSFGQRHAPRVGDDALVEAPDYWTQIDGAPAQVAVARAALAEAPGAIWTSADELVAAVGRPGATVLVDTTAFAHTTGAPDDAPPSATATYQSLAAAVVARSPLTFAPGESNLSLLAHVGGSIDTAGEA